jgi:hypothetical protein
MAARLGYTNLLTVSGVVISSSSEGTGYVDDNLANPARWKKWRSATSTADQWVKFDLGSNQSFQVLAAISATIHVGGTLKAQANATDVWGAPTVDDTLTVPSPDLTHVLVDWLSTVKSLRWIRFYFTNTAAVSAYVELGAVFAGTYLEPGVSIKAGFDISPRDLSAQRYAIGGQRMAVRRSQYRQLEGIFRRQSSTDRDNWGTAFAAIGTHTPCLFAADPTVNNLTLYGHFERLDTLHYEGTANKWHVPFSFREDIP